MKAIYTCPLVRESVFLVLQEAWLEDLLQRVTRASKTKIKFYTLILSLNGLLPSVIFMNDLVLILL